MPPSPVEHDSYKSFSFALFFLALSGTYILVSDLGGRCKLLSGSPVCWITGFAQSLGPVSCWRTSCLVYLSIFTEKSPLPVIFPRDLFQKLVVKGIFGKWMGVKLVQVKQIPFLYYLQPKENKIAPRKDPRRLQSSEELVWDGLGTKALLFPWLSSWAMDMLWGQYSLCRCSQYLGW